MANLTTDWSQDLLLWATRGKSWGFRILWHPDIRGVDWLSVYEEVFSQTDCSPAFFFAELETQKHGKLDLIAARFADPDCSCDDAKRLIPHEVILLAKPGLRFPPRSDLPTDWYLPVFDVLRTEFQRVYAMESVGHLPLKFEASGTLERRSDNLPVSCRWKDLGLLRPEPKPSKKKMGRRIKKAIALFHRLYVCGTGICRTCSVSSAIGLILSRITQQTRKPLRGAYPSSQEARSSWFGRGDDWQEG